MKPLDTLIIGGGMITNDLLLPSVYQLQRGGRAGKITVCALNSAPLRAKLPLARPSTAARSPSAPGAKRPILSLTGQPAWRARGEGSTVMPPARPDGPLAEKAP